MKMAFPASLIKSLGWDDNLTEVDTLLHESAHAGDLEEIKDIMKYDENRRLINQKNRLGCSPLRIAAAGGHTDVVTYLICYGADVNSFDIKHQTPLFVAVKKQHLKCIRVLLRAGANPDGDKSSTCTPLYIAAMEGFYPGVCELLKGGADVDKSHMSIGMSMMSSPLHISAIYGYFNCFFALIVAGADPNNCTNNHRGTIYHSLVKYDSANVKFVELLYESGADVYVTNDQGKFPHDIVECDLNPTAAFIQLIFRNPRSLLSGCRLVIRHTIGKKNLPVINELPLPQKLLAYLQFR
ncbi:ankyrin repeat and SOCS box protein 12-like [Tubulanus polymorphus]|uniref:ankyrin repeat and SOCS box protein 12-like n=1 Tax=Tubulanus polymorphus TaxID=672921 RepID=UPI003DA5C382